MVSSTVDPKVRALLLVLVVGAVTLMLTTDPEPTGLVPAVHPSAVSLLEDNDEVRVIITYRESARARGMSIAEERSGRSLPARIEPRVISARELEILSASPEIESIVPDARVRSSLEDSREIINTSVVWDLDLDGTSPSGSTSTVCVIDTGIDYTHPALGGCTTDEFLAGNCSKIPGGYDFYNSDDDPWDDNGHGTHVAGIIAANGSVTGVAPQSRLVAIKSLDENGDGWISDVLLGVDWCTNNKDDYNISIISMSLGGLSFSDTCDSYEPSWTAIIDDAVAAGISVVSATGNDGWTNAIAFPACINSSMRVGASTSSDSIASFTNRAESFPDILLAPGVSITSTVPGGGSAANSGTSMSTPHVSGAIALLEDYLTWQNETATPAQMIDAFLETGLAIYDSSTDTDYHRIDAAGLVFSFDTTPPTIELTYNQTPLIGTNWTVSWNVSDEIEVDTVHVNVSYAETSITSDEIEGNITIDEIEGGAYTIEVSANDTAGNTAAIVEKSPTANISYDAQPLIDTNWTLDWNITDDGIIDTVNVTVTGAGTNVERNETSGTITIEEISGGAHTIRIFANDTDGNTLRTVESFTVLTNPSYTFLIEGNESNYTRVGSSNISIAVNLTDGDMIELIVNGSSEGSSNESIEHTAELFEPGIYEAVVRHNETENYYFHETKRTITIIDPAPIISSMDPAESEVVLLENETISFAVNASDPYEEGLNYTWRINETVIGTDANSTIEGISFDTGSYAVNVTIENNHSSIGATWNLSIEPIGPIVQEYPEEGIVELEHNETAAFSANATDVRGRTIAFTWRYDGTEISNTSEAELNATSIESGVLSLNASNGLVDTIVEWTIEVLPEPIALEMISTIPSLSWEQGSSETLDLDEHFSVTQDVNFSLETDTSVTMSVSDGTATLSAPSSYSGSGSARIEAERGSENATSNEFSIEVHETTSGGSGGGGGGGGSSGGSVWTPPPTQTEDEPEPEPVERIIRAERLGSFELIEARVVSASSETHLQVRDLETVPEHVPRFEGRAYAIVDITSEESVEQVNFSFFVASSWIEQEGISADSINLYRYAGDWEELETTMLGYSEGSYRYSARSSGLSVFVIGAIADDGRSDRDQVRIVIDEPLAFSEEPSSSSETRLPPGLLIALVSITLFVILSGTILSIALRTSRNRDDEE